MEVILGILIDIFGVLGPINVPPDKFENIRYIYLHPAIAAWPPD